MTNNILYIFFIGLIFFSCGNDDEPMPPRVLVDLDVLAADNAVARDSVIACASGSENPGEYIVYAYPRPGAEDIRYFETDSISVDPNDFSNYSQVDITEEDFFNGYLIKFTRETSDEKWVIVSFFENDILNLSTPIRIKHLSQSTLFTEEVIIDQAQVGEPLFDWTNITDPQDAIYFQVVSDANDNLLSGTYTFDPQFRYYNLDNVVLNITRETPPDLIINNDYQFTLMGVSVDNWVNTIVQKRFVAEP